MKARSKRSTKRPPESPPAAWIRTVAGVVLAAALASVSWIPAGSSESIRSSTQPTFSNLADDVVATIMRHWYAGGSRFRECSDCAAAVASDWGADSLIDVLYERWLLTRDVSVTKAFKGIVAGEPGNTLGGFSDVPMWDAVAAIRAYDVTHDPRALREAEREYHALATSRDFALEPCPAIDAQIRRGGGLGFGDRRDDEAVEVGRRAGRVRPADLALPGDRGQARRHVR